jgi:acetyltransferase-like isoleucine patch superfamily enzyme
MTNNNSESDFKVYEEAFSSFTKRSLKRIKNEPYILIPGLMAYLKGLYYKIKFKLLFKSVKIGRHFRVYGKLIITGPGRVIFGNDCFIISQVTKTVRIKSMLPDSKLILGDHVGLNGTSIVCRDKISIGDFSNIADAYITDTSAHPISIDRRLYSAQDVPAEKVYIGKNVWISVNSVILKGVSIGDNSVIGACSLVRKSLPANVLAAGLPAKIIRELPTSYSTTEK